MPLCPQTAKYANSPAATTAPAVAMLRRRRLGAFSPAFPLRSSVWAITSSPGELLHHPLLCQRAQRVPVALAPHLGVHAHHGFGAAQPVAHPRAVIENQLEPLRPHHTGHLAAAELGR